jgi:hypothetical protein
VQRDFHRNDGGINLESQGNRIGFTRESHLDRLQRELGGKLDFPPVVERAAPQTPSTTELTSDSSGVARASFELRVEFGQPRNFQVRDTASAAPHSNALELCCGVELEPGDFMPALLLQCGARRLGGCPLYYSKP